MQNTGGGTNSRMKRPQPQPAHTRYLSSAAEGTVDRIKGPDNPTSQLLPKMSFNGFSGDREAKKDKGDGERSRR